MPHGDGAPIHGEIMNVWRIIAHHESVTRAVQRYRDEGFVALGWGGIGDLTAMKPDNPDVIAEEAKTKYPDIANTAECGRCLYAFYKDVEIGDLIILSDGKNRLNVFKVTGDYYFEPKKERDIGEHQHRREVKLSFRDPEKMWKRPVPVEGEKWNSRWAFIRRGRFG